MDIKSLLELISSDIRDIGRITSGMGNAEKIQQFDIDLAISKTKTLAEEIQMLNMLNAVTENIVKDLPEYSIQEIINIKGSMQKDYKSEIKEEHILKAEKEQKATADISHKPEAEKEKTEILIQQHIKETEQTDVISGEGLFQKKTDKKTPQNKNSIETKVAEQNERQSLSDRLKNDKRSLIDMISEKIPDKDIASKITANRITDIRSAIPLNDKVFFIKELFGGDADKMNIAIDIINKSTDRTSAMRYLAETFNWAEGSVAAKKFYSLIDRRFN